ncbi:MAG: YbfB/YjiJ family MFS transporter [Alphaproteobacteria bacterium]|nr:YbfB/YjiJ family MFS transporter [Alphaproteobacteria bacterium]
MPRPAAIPIAAVTATAIAQGCGRFALTPLLPDMQAAAALDHRAAGLLAAANFAGYLAGSLLLLARAGSLPVAPVAVGLAAVVVGSVAMAFVPSPALWIAARFVAGAGGALLFLGALDAAARLAPDLGPQPFAGVGLGIVATGLLALALLPDWRLGWTAVGLLAVAAWPLARRLRAGGPRAVPAEPRPPATPALLRLALAYTLFAVAFGAAATFFVALFAGGDARHATLAWIVAGLCAAPSVPLWARAARRFGDAGALVAALALEAAGIALAALDGRLAAAAVAGALLGGTFMGITALGLMRARSLAATAPRRTSALLTALFGLGQIGGAPIAGWIAAGHGGLPAGLAFAAGAAGLAAALLLPDVARTGPGAVA